MRPVLLLAVLLLGAFGGCSAAPTSPSRAEWLDYRRVGGLAGWNDHLTIQENRSAVLTRSTGTFRFTVEQATFSALQRQLGDGDFEHLNATYLPSDPCCDQVDHTVRYREHTVRALDAAVPAALLPVLVTLGDIIVANGGPR
jgi:hypothetical protein